jgi:AAA domain-containing protein/UvrD-like helicase family protein
LTIELTPEQRTAMDTVLDWYRGGGSTLTLGGYAGTGKTTLLGLLPSELRRLGAFGPPVIHFCSYTGKAVSVLQSKLPPGARCSTIHRLLYQPRHVLVCKLSGEPVEYQGAFCEEHQPQPVASSGDFASGTPLSKPISVVPGTKLTLELVDPKQENVCETKRTLDWSMRMSPLAGIDLVVVDEASMVSDRIWTDLTRWGVPVLAVGDHGQLEPIKSDFNLMAKPEIRLETILRQVADSPIIKMSIMSREEGRIKQGHYGDNCVKFPRHRLQAVLRKIHPKKGDMVICAYNRTRNETNDRLRHLAGRSGPVQIEDVVICLRNSYENGVFNGQRGTVTEVGDIVGDGLSFFRRGGPTRFLSVRMESEDYEVAGEVLEEQFGAPKTKTDADRRFLLFDYGYALTCHKAQGSQADRVLVIEERLPQTDYNRWLYTAVTRAAKELCVIGGG